MTNPQVVIPTSSAILGQNLAFSPLSVANLVLWLAADRIAGAADGDAVGTWSDLSGQANHATQATGSKQPLYRVGAINGKPSLRFDATDDFLQTAAFTGGTIAQPVTMLVVGKMPRTSNAQFFDGRDGTNRMFMSDSGSHAFQLFAGAFVTTGALGNDAGYHVHTIVWDATDVHSLDGVTGASGSAGTNSLAGMTIGARFDGTSGFLGGDIPELLVYSGAVAYADVQRLQRSLSAKYHLPVS